MVSAIVVMVDECADLSFKVFRKEVVFQQVEADQPSIQWIDGQRNVFQHLVPALDLALGLRMTGRAVKLLHLPVLQPVRQVFGDVASAIIRQKPRFVLHLDAVAAGCRKRNVQRVGYITHLHVRAQFPSHDISGKVIEDGGQIEPAPADHLQIGEIGLPHLIGANGLVPEFIVRLDDDEGWRGDQIVRLEQAIDGRL